jgi:hypothetical protein
MSKRRVLYMRLICRRMVLYCYLSAAGRRQAFLPLRLTAAGAGASLRPVRGAWSSLRRIYKYDKDHSGGAALPYLITYPRSGVGATALDGGADVRRGGGGMRKWRWIRCHDHIPKELQAPWFCTLLVDWVVAIAGPTHLGFSAWMPVDLEVGGCFAAGLC